LLRTQFDLLNQRLGAQNRRTIRLYYAPGRFKIEVHALRSPTAMLGAARGAECTKQPRKSSKKSLKDRKIATNERNKKSPAARAGLSSVDNCLKLKQLSALYGKRSDA
jgi:hypothetical protein